MILKSALPRTVGMEAAKSSGQRGRPGGFSAPMSQSLDASPGGGSGTPS